MGVHRVASLRTGLSSLSQVRKLQFDMKLDRSLMADLYTDLGARESPPP
jgi:EAL domain-containing protein (putative c-di-GMP-specific phosphodiesterase class I)